jgi:histidyl-tRNA synthetase
LRREHISAETYLRAGGLKAQLRHAARRKAQVCVIYGPADRAAGTVTVRNLDSGEQVTGPLAEVAQLVRRHLMPDAAKDLEAAPR